MGLVCRPLVRRSNRRATISQTDSVDDGSFLTNGEVIENDR